MITKREKLQYGYLFVTDLASLALSIGLGWLLTDQLLGKMPTVSTNEARLLYLKGHTVQIVLAGSRSKATPENRTELQIAQNYGVAAMDADTWLETAHGENDYDIVIDALFGVGLSRRIEGVYGQLIDRLNCLRAKKVAVDIPSGIDADDGQVLAVAFQADLAVTFSSDKLGMDRRS